MYKMRKETQKCDAVVARDSQVVAPCQHLSYYPFAVAKGEGDILTDEDGNEYIDFLTSASSLNLGSSNKMVTHAIQEQLSKYTQYTAAYSYNEPMTSYAEKLTSVYPGGIKAKVCFGNCGSDGNDAAVKFARAFTGRSKIITFINGYHGNTYGSASMTAVTTRMRKKMGPFLPDIYHFPFFGDEVSDDVCGRECMKAMEEAFHTWLPADEVAAVVIEPIQGDAGIVPAHPIFLKKLYERCKKEGILFIAEEVQQGFFRAGHWFSIENYPGIIPDGIIMGKSIGGGLTLGAFMGRADMMDTLPAPAHLFTLGGNAIACAAGGAAFDIYRSEEFQMQYRKNCTQMIEEMKMLQDKHPHTAGRFHGRGLSYGMDVVRSDDQGNKGPDDKGAFKIVFRAYEKGLIIITIGGHVLRIQPPLNISSRHMREAFQILDDAFTEMEEGRIPDGVFEYQHGW